MVNEEFKQQRENVLKRAGLVKLLRDLRSQILSKEGDKTYCADGLFTLNINEIDSSEQEIYRRLPFQASVQIFAGFLSGGASYLEVADGSGQNYEEAYDNLLNNLGEERRLR